MSDRFRQSRRALLGSLALTASAGCLRSQAGQPSETPAASTATETPEPDATTEGWPTFGADRTGRGTADVTAPGSSPAAEWSADLDAAAGDPVVADGTVYVAGRTDIVAVDAATGTEQWAYEVGLVGDGPAPTVVGDTLYATPGDGYAYALSTDGNFRWSEQLTDGNGVTTGTPRLAGDTVVVADQRQVAGLAAETGEREWSWTAPGNGVTGLATDGEVVYVGLFPVIDEPTIVALDTSSGETVWRQTGQFNGAHGPAVVDGTVYAGGATELTPLFALDAETGETRWTCPVDGAIRSSPAVGESTVYVPDLGGTLHAVARESGEVRWRTDVAEAPADVEPPTVSSPALVDGLVYVGTLDGRLVVVDAADGSVRSAPGVGETVRCSPAVAGGRVFVGDTDGALRAYGAD